MTVRFSLVFPSLSVVRLWQLCLKSCVVLLGLTLGLALVILMWLLRTWTCILFLRAQWNVPLTRPVSVIVSIVGGVVIDNVVLCLTRIAIGCRLRPACRVLMIRLMTRVMLDELLLSGFRPLSCESSSRVLASLADRCVECLT